MNKSDLVNEIRKKRTFLCVGLDTDIDKVPAFLKSEPDPLFAFNKQIIDATLDYCVSYKINTAFYEALGAKGWESLEKTVSYLPDTVFKIADAKRGDIGNTTEQYAKGFFKTLNFDAITIAPYMGADSITPFLSYKDKWAIVLALTSNKSSEDFQLKALESSKEELYKEVLSKTASLGSAENTMFVVGATKAEALREIRRIVPEHFLLIPGVGAQGGSLEDVIRLGKTKDYGLLINSSRNIIYASSEKDFAIKAKEVARQMSIEIGKYI